MATAYERGWGDPDAPNYRRDKIRAIDAGGVKVYVHKDVAIIFTYLLNSMANYYDLAGYRDDWGYANRDVRGRPGVKSNHSWGLAVDLNATRNTMTSSTTYSPEFKKVYIDRILSRCRGLLIWGGDYKSSRKDYMHFEFIGTPKQAKSVSDSLRKADLMATLDAEDLQNIKKIVDEETNQIYWLLAGVPKGTPFAQRPTLKQILDKTT